MTLDMELFQHHHSAVSDTPRITGKTRYPRLNCMRCVLMVLWGLGVMMLVRIHPVNFADIVAWLHDTGRDVGVATLSAPVRVQVTSMPSPAYDQGLAPAPPCATPTAEAAKVAVARHPPDTHCQLSQLSPHTARKAP